MAVAVYFKKVREDAETVVYAFGPEIDSLERTFDIDQATRTVRADDSGSPDRLLSKAVGRIIARFREEDAWPDEGQSIS